MRRIGFLDGRISVAVDFDQMGGGRIAELVPGGVWNPMSALPSVFLAGPTELWRQVNHGVRSGAYYA